MQNLLCYGFSAHIFTARVSVYSLSFIIQQNLEMCSKVSHAERK